MVKIGGLDWVNNVLSWPLGGDGSEVKVIHDKVVVARKQHVCGTCFGPVEPRTFSRVETGVVDGKLKTLHHCQECCKAMATKSDPALAMEKRHKLAHQRFRGNQV